MHAGKSRVFLALSGMLILALPHAAVAQSTGQQAPSSTSSQNASPPSSTQPVASGTAPDSYSSQSGQPMSLGEAARLARLRKKSQPKATQIFDDDNMPRAPLQPGQQAPGFSAPSPPSSGDGQSSSSSGADQGSSSSSADADRGSPSGGKVTLLDFCASWCGPCRESLPGLRELASAYTGQDFEIISIGEDRDENAWREFVAQNDMPWEHRYDPQHEMMRQYGYKDLPTYVLIGRDGRVVQHYEGFDTEEPLINRIGPDLKKSLAGE